MRTIFEQQIVFFLPVDPWTKNTRILGTIDLNAPRHAQDMHKAWKKHLNTVCWVDINLALKKGLKFYQTRSNAIILCDTLPAYCIPKVVRMETGEVLHEKVYASPRPPPKISLKHDWMKDLGREVAQRPDGQVVQQIQSSQSNQPDPNPDHDRTGQPVVGRDANHEPRVSQTRSSDDSKSFNVEDKTAHDRTVQPVITRDANHEPGVSQTRSSHQSTNFDVGDETNHDKTETPVVGRDASHVQGNDQSMLNEVNIDFRKPGLPHSFVKQAENSCS